MGKLLCLQNRGWSTESLSWSRPQWEQESRWFGDNCRPSFANPWSCLWGSVKTPAPDPRSDTDPLLVSSPLLRSLDSHMVLICSPGCPGLVPLSGAISFPTLPSPGPLGSALLPGFEPHLYGHPIDLPYLNPDFSHPSVWEPSLVPMLAIGIFGFVVPTRSLGASCLPPLSLIFSRVIANLLPHLCYLFHCCKDTGPFIYISS